MALIRRRRKSPLDVNVLADLASSSCLIIPSPLGLAWIPQLAMVPLHREWGQEPALGFVYASLNTNDHDGTRFIVRHGLLCHRLALDLGG